MGAQPDYGRVTELLGIARDAGGWSFVPARVQLPPGMCADGPGLKPFLEKLRPGVLALLPESDTDAIWARARIEALFGIASVSEDERVEKALMEFGFVARHEQGGSDVEIPFVCSDYYGRSRLDFAAAVPAAQIGAIGEAFWGLVASSGMLADYRDRALHLGACVWMEFGCSNGTLFLTYLDDEDEEAPPPIDPVAEELATARDFLDRLGPESPGTVCNEAGCGRGTVQASLFCRRHHFEAVMGRPCPIQL